MMWYVCDGCRFCFSLRTERCPLCGAASITPAPEIEVPYRQPLTPWILSKKDWTFLHAIRVDPEQAEPTFG